MRIDVERGDFVLDRRDFIVLPSDRFVGLKLPRSFLGADEALEIRGVVVDKAGNPVPGAEVMLELVRQVRRGALMSSEVAQTATSRSGGDGIFQIPIGPKFADRYSVRAWVTDERGRKSMTEAILVIARRPGLAIPIREGSSSPGSDWSLPSIVSARTTVSPDSELDVLIQAPFLRGTGLLRVPSRDGTRIISFRFEEGSKVLSIPVSLDALGDWPLSVEVVGPNEADYISASIGISVVQPELRVVAKTRRKLLSSRRLVDLVILDSAGEPVAGAWVALAWTDGRYAKFADDEYPARVEEGGPRYFGKDSVSLRDHLVRAPYVPEPHRSGPPWIQIVGGSTSVCGPITPVRTPLLPVLRAPGGLIEITTDLNGRASAELPVVSRDGGPFRVNVLVVGSDGSVGRTILWVDAAG